MSISGADYQEILNRKKEQAQITAQRVSAIRQTEAAQQLTAKPLNLTQITPYEQAKKFIMNAIFKVLEKEVNLTPQIIRERVKKQATAWALVTKWLINDPTPVAVEKGEFIQGLPLDKGIWITGPVGTGKTRMAEVLYLVGSLIGSTKVGPVIRTDKMQAQMLVSQAQFDNRQVSMDDIGRDKEMLHYGNAIDPICALLQDKYERWQKSGTPMVATSNFSLSRKAGAEYLTNRYGAHTLDRMRHMFTEVELVGSSLREA